MACASTTNIVLMIQFTCIFLTFDPSLYQMYFFGFVYTIILPIEDLMNKHRLYRTVSVPCAVVSHIHFHFVSLVCLVLDIQSCGKNIRIDRSHLFLRLYAGFCVCSTQIMSLPLIFSVALRLFVAHFDIFGIIINLVSR
jgi:hypothetical protein